MKKCAPTCVAATSSNSVDVVATTKARASAIVAHVVSVVNKHLLNHITTTYEKM